MTPSLKIPAAISHADMSRTVRVQSRRASRASEIKPVLRSSADAILLFDRNLRIAGVNLAARKILGQPGQKLLGRCYQDIFRWDSGDQEPVLLLA